MTEHDPMCPYDQTAYKPVGPMGPDEYVGPSCVCTLISKARYDGRKAGYEEGYDHGTFHGYADGWRESLAGFREYLEKAVISKCAHTKYEGCRPCIHDEIVALILGED